MEQKTFLCLSTEEIAAIVKERGLPKTGVFVPDGNRRLVLATSDLQENTNEFYHQLGLTHTENALIILQIFFSHGLSNLFIPMFSHSVLLRGEKYCQYTVLETLRILFATESYLDFFDSLNVRVKVYGNLSVLDEVECSQAKEWINQIENHTKKYEIHSLFFGIGGESLSGYDAAVAGSSFYQHFQSQPSPEELIQFYYGQSIPPADFYIMCSKLGGLGAVPPLLCGRQTQVYYLPVPGVIAVTQQTYRKILYDLLYSSDITFKELNNERKFTERDELRSWYTVHQHEIIGLRNRIGSVTLS